MKKSIRIMSYNIHAGIGIDNKYDLGRIANVIKESSSDIIGLQEVDVCWDNRSNWDNQVKKLAKKLGMYYFFAPIYNLDPPIDRVDRRQHGVAILSKYPIIKCCNRELTRLSTQDVNANPKLMPGFAESKIDVDGITVWFYVTHLDYRSDSSIREMQVDEMLRIFSSVEGEKVLVGDMNARPEAPELKLLFEYLNDIGEFIDRDGGFTFPAGRPDRRIDYILTTSRIEVQNGKVLNAKGSDHLPVIADLVFNLT